MQKVKQQQFILRLALYILQANGHPKPPKRQVLNFIKSKNLMNIPDEKKGKRYDDDADEIWKNDIAWKRKDLFDDGLIDSPERGLWHLTKHGISRIEEKKEGWKDLSSAPKMETFLEHMNYLTTDTVKWMLKIANNHSLSLKQHKSNKSE